MSALAQSIENQNSQSDVTKISANARIDYVLRFSKHAILVIDENSNNYSRIGHQFLADLAAEQNAAFVAVSTKHNDIQLRCRIVEQLFGNSLFDPEQSLAVSLFNLSQEDKSPISIVLEHCQHLSLQIFHELCQLAEIAKKRKQVINIVFLGDQKAGQTIAEHRTLFDNKITIVSAETGQVIPLSSKQLKFEQQLWSFSTGAKVFLALAVFTAILVATLITMYKQDVFNFATALNESISEEIKIESVDVIEIETDKVIQQEQGVKTVTEQANSTDILQALVAGEVIVEVKPEPEKASPIDIITAIAKLDSSEKQTFEKPSTSSLTQENVDEMDIKQQPAEVIAPVKELTKTVSGEELVNKINSNYYLSQQTGFVIQFAGFREEKGYQDFITQNQTIEHMAYYRMLADNPFITVTSIVYPTRIEAQQQMDKFAQQMPDRGLWVKSLNVIKDEINTFQSSQ